MRLEKANNNEDKVVNLREYKEFNNVPDVVLKVLLNRGISERDDIKKFIECKITSLENPNNIKDASIAADIIISSIKNREKIVLVGDYDCDGICSTAMGVKALRALGANIDYIVNNRFEEGYGITSGTVENILSKYPNVKLVITCDNGITGHTAVDELKSKNIKVIITDHHEPMDKLPNADAIVDLKRADETHKFKELCGTGILYKLLMLIYQKLNISEKNLYKFLELVALATVADIVPLVDENRILVKNGLHLINNHPSIQMTSLKEAYNIDGSCNAHSTLAFIFAPTINAIGRMEGVVDKAIDMFLSNDESFIRETVNYLKDINNKRKSLSEKEFNKADLLVQKNNMDKLIYVYSEDFSEGLIGLIAGKLKTKYHIPVFVLTKKDGKLIGSARSIDGLDMKSVLDECSDLLLGYGGHQGAAGFSLELKDILDLKVMLTEKLNKLVTKEMTQEKMIVDCSIVPEDITKSAVESIKILEPYGKDFEEPHFLLKNVSIDNIFYMGANKQHTKLMHDELSIISWNSGQDISSYPHINSISCVGCPNLNHYKGRTSVQFMANYYLVME